MPAAIFITATLALALTALGTGPIVVTEPLPTPELVVHQRLFVVQGHDLSASIPLDLLGGEEPSRVKPLDGPRHGSYLSGTWPDFVYQPEPDYFGYDSFVLEIPAPEGTVYVDFEVMVLPARIPLQGRWTAGAGPLPGLYDPQRGRFQLCTGMAYGCLPGDTELASPTGGSGQCRVLICEGWPVRDAPPAAIPLVLPSSSGEGDQLALFAPATGVLYHLYPDGSSFVAYGEKTAPETLGRFPVAGTFAVDTPPAIAFVDRQGAVGVLSEWGSWEEWPSPLEVSAGGDELVWPVSLPFAGADGLAVISPATSILDLLAATGQHTSLEPIFGDGDVRRPFGASLEEDYAPVKFLLGDPATGFFIDSGWWSSGDGEDPTPTTYPLKFPDDPPFP